MRSCKVAVIGAGYTAREHLRAFKDVPGVELAGICSRTRARAEVLAAELGVAVVCDTVSQLHSRTGADLVVVTVPELSMRAVAEACFEHPWVVLTEKPAGYDLADALALQASADRAGRRVHVALNRRCLSATRACLDGLAGVDAPRFIKVQDQQNQARARAGGQPELVVANWMFANSIHLVDYFRVFARGQLETIERVLPWRGEGTPFVVLRLGFTSGDIGLYEGIWQGPGPWACTVTAATQRWEMRPLEQVITQRLGEPPTTLPADPRDTAFKPGFRLQAELAVNAATGGDAGPLPTLDEAVETMRLIDRMFAPTP